MENPTELQALHQMIECCEQVRATKAEHRYIEKCLEVLVCMVNRAIKDSEKKPIPEVFNKPSGVRSIAKDATPETLNN